MPLATFGVVERLDAERIAREVERAGAGIGERDGVHAAQGLGEVGALGARRSSAAIRNPNRWRTSRAENSACSST